MSDFRYTSLSSASDTLRKERLRKGRFRQAEGDFLEKFSDHYSFWQIEIVCMLSSKFYRRKTLFKASSSWWQ